MPTRHNRSCRHKATWRSSWDPSTGYGGRKSRRSTSADTWAHSWSTCTSCWGTTRTFSCRLASRRSPKSLDCSYSCCTFSGTGWWWFWWARQSVFCRALEKCPNPGLSWVAPRWWRYAQRLWYQWTLGVRPSPSGPPGWCSSGQSSRLKFNNRFN